MVRIGARLGLAVTCLALAQAGARALAPTGSSPLDGTAVPPAIERAPESLPARDARPQDRRLSGNPLWAVPLRSLSVTSERPIFSPSRRPPIPPVVAVAY